MRRTLRMPIVFLCWALAPACLKVPAEGTEDPSATTAAPTSAKEILARYVQAIGGEEALRARTDRTVEARLVLRAEDGCEPDDRNCLAEDQSGSSFHQSTADGRMYQRTVVAENVEEHGFNGEVGWGLMSDQALRIDTAEEAKVSREEGLLHWYFDLESRGIELTMLPPREQDSQGNAVVLDGFSWQSPGAPLAKELWFVRETGLLREEVSRDEQGDFKQSQIVTYDDYREVDGIKIPHTIAVKNQVGDRVQRVEFLTQRVHHEPIDASRFAIPTLPEAKPKPDPLLTRLDTVRAEARAEPKDVPAQVEWARTAFMAGHFTEAFDAAKVALALDAQEPEALLTLIRVHTLRGEYAKALKVLKTAQRSGIREQVLAREEAWILHRKRDFPRLADALDAADSSTLAGRYRAFAGTPLVQTWPGNQCSSEIDLLDNDPLALVPLDVGGTSTSAIFDTGAADLIIAKSLADELGVAIQSRTKVAEGFPDIGHGQIESVKLGDLVLANVPVNVFDDLSIEQMAGKTDTPVRAVFGAALLQDYVVGVNIPGKKLQLVPTARRCKAQADALRQGPSTPLYLHETHYLYVAAKMNDAEGVYLLNTGMRGADLTANRFANDYAGIGMPPMRSDETPMVKVRRLELAEGIEVQEADAAYGLFQQTQSSDGFRVDGMLGLGVLGRRPFVLDFENLELYFPPA